MPPHISNLIPGREYGIGIGDFKATLMLKSNTNPTSGVSSLTSLGLAQRLDDPRLIATIPTDYPSLISIECLGIREAWISGSQNIIRLVDINGSVKNTISSKAPNDISATKIVNLLFSDNSHQGGTVKIAKNGQVEHRIQMSSTTFSGAVCYTRSGDILVHIIDECFDGNTFHKISRYRRLKIVQEIEIDEQGKRNFEHNSSQLYLSEHNNSDICVSDTETKSVVILDRTGKVTTFS